MDFTGRGRKRQQLLPHLDVEQIRSRLLSWNFAHLALIVEIVDRFFVSLAHLDQIRGKLAGLGLAFAEITLEVAAVPPDGFAQLRQSLERLENVLELGGAELLVVGQVLQPDIFGAQRDQNLVQLNVVVHVLLALLALDLVERRLRDVDFAGAHQLRHLPVEERQEQGANVRAVHVRVGHDDDVAVAKFRDVE